MTFENYDVARNPETNKKVAGEVKIYVLSALSNQEYYLTDATNTMLNAQFAQKDGYRNTGHIQGVIKPTSDAVLSDPYTTEESSGISYHYLLSVETGYPDDAMYVVEGSASRITPTKARVAPIITPVWTQLRRTFPICRLTARQ